MTTIEINRSGLLASIRERATEKDGVRALVQTGSLVRRDGLADEFSDLDIEIVTRDPASLIESDAWVHEIGRPITILHLDAEDGQEWSTRLVIFEGGIKVDFTLTGLRRLESMSGANGLDPLYERGYSILLDKDGLTKGLPAPSFAAPVRPFPSESHFRERVEEFWFEAFHVPRYLARGELYQVKQRDWTMKELLLEMMEWHALARSGGSVDVWHIGKGIRSWTDSATWTELQETFSHFDAEDARRAHTATTQLYSRLARDVASMEGWTYPDKVEELISALDLRPFAGAERKLAADPKAWIETSDLLAGLKWNAREPIPDVVLAHLRDRLDGTAKKRQGRGRSSPSRKMRDSLISVRFERIETWLNARQDKHGLEGWRTIRDAEWWQGPPSERAARMVQRGLELHLDWESVRNIAYRIRKNGFPPISYR